MEKEYADNEVFENLDFTRTPLAHNEFESCQFRSCNFGNTDLSHIKFFDCHFSTCNFSLATLTKTSFRNGHFKDCKMLGLHFEHCSPLGLEFGFESCNLTHSSFFGLRLKKAVFTDTILQNCDFAGTDLSEAVLDRCDLSGAAFENTNLEEADLRTSFNYLINPELNRVKKARFGLSGLPGLLEKYDIIIDLNN